ERVSLDNPLHISDSCIEMGLQRRQREIDHASVDEGKARSENRRCKNPWRRSWRAWSCNRRRTNHALIAGVPNRFGEPHAGSRHFSRVTRPPVIPGFDGPDGLFELPGKNALPEQRQYGPECSSLEVLALAHHDGVYLRCPV